MPHKHTPPATQAQRFATRLKTARTSQNLTQGALAAACGIPTVDHRKICRYEAGKHLPHVRHLIALAGALRVSTDYLLHNDDGKHFGKGGGL